MRIKIFSVGGTIDKVYFDQLSRYQVGFPSIREILEGLPIGFEYDIESLLRKDSLEMTDDDRELVRSAVSETESDRVLITHGTDTMIETARSITPRAHQCVVLTGALEPANFKSSDAVFNVGTAIGALGSRPEGVYIAMNGLLFDPHRCRKNRELGRFESTDGEAGSSSTVPAASPD